MYAVAHAIPNLRMCDSELLDVFINGLSFNMTSDKGHFLINIVETDKTKASFIHDGKWDGTSRLFSNWSYPPCCWYTHFHNYCFPRARIQIACCLCWMSWVDNSQNEWQVTLQYQKLQKVLAKLASSRWTAFLTLNFNAMVDELYKILDDQQMQNIYTETSAIHFLKKESFKSKLHSQAQEFQIGLIVVKSFFMDWVPDHKGDLLFWMKPIFCPCWLRNDYILFCNNVFLLFHYKGNPQLATELLTKFPVCITQWGELPSSIKVTQTYLWWNCQEYDRLFFESIPGIWNVVNAQKHIACLCWLDRKWAGCIHVTSAMLDW